MRTEKEILNAILEEIDKNLTVEQKKESKRIENHLNKSIDNYERNHQALTTNERTIFNYGHYWGRMYGELKRKREGARINWKRWTKRERVEDKQYLIVDTNNKFGIGKPHLYQKKGEPTIRCWIMEDKSINFNVTHFAEIFGPKDD